MSANAARRKNGSGGVFSFNPQPTALKLRVLSFIVLVLNEIVLVLDALSSSTSTSTNSIAFTH